MAQLYKDGKMKDPLTFSFGLITPSGSGTQYLLRIENLTQFNLFVNKVTGPVGLLYWQYYAESYVMASNNNAQNEIGLLNFFEKYNAGISLFKGNSSFTSWDRVKVSGTGTSATIVNNPCN